jgi:hypothetical protein
MRIAECGNSAAAAGTHLRAASSGKAMSDDKTYSQPSDVDAKDGAVAVHGPDNVDVDMTPEAAEETADRLTDQAVKARGQRRLMRFPHQAR